MSKSTFPVQEKASFGRQAYNDFFKSNGVDTVFNTEGPSLTRQEFVEECDINALMSRYDAHVIGGPGNMPAAEPLYADFAEMPDTLLGYLEFMENAEKAFMRLPAVVRKEFDNSAPLFVDFASNPDNLDQMRSWGLAPPAKAPEPAPGASAVAAGASAASAPPGAPSASGGASTHGST